MIVGEYSLRCTCNTCGKLQEYTTPMRAGFTEAVVIAERHGWVFAWQQNRATCGRCATPTQKSRQAVIKRDQADKK